jgi:hypothetical protein
MKVSSTRAVVSSILLLLVTTAGYGPTTTIGRWGVQSQELDSDANATDSIGADAADDDLSSSVETLKNFTSNQGLRALIKVREGKLDDFLAIASDFARDRQIATIINKRRILALRISNMDILEQISASELVEHAELDGVLSTSVGTCDYGPHSFRILSGDQSETMPYGIAMVQADQLWDIPEEDTTIQICVVDTGYNAGHPDLPSVFGEY